MEDSPLSRLPAELRNKIYESVLTAPGSICFRFSRKDQTWTSDLRHKYDHLLAITKTCRKLRLECEKMVIALNTFEIRFDDSNVRERLNSFRSHLDQTGTSDLRSIVADVRPLVAQGPLRSHQQRMSFVGADLLSALGVLQEEAEDHPYCDFRVLILPENLQAQVHPFSELHLSVGDLTLSCKELITSLEKHKVECPKEVLWLNLAIFRLQVLTEALMRRSA